MTQPALVHLRDSFDHAKLVFEVVVVYYDKKLEEAEGALMLCKEREEALITGVSDLTMLRCGEDATRKLLDLLAPRSITPSPLELPRGCLMFPVRRGRGDKGTCGGRDNEIVYILAHISISL